jgi:hypothetical protein
LAVVATLSKGYDLD